MEQARVAGIAIDAIAKKHGVSADALYRHCKNHLTDEDRARYIADVPIKELAAKAADQGASLLDYFTIIRGTMMEQFQLAARMNDRHAMTTVCRALVEVLREIGKLTGELLNTASVTNVQNNYFAFANSPVFADLTAMLMQALADEPAALQKVIAGLDELEARANHDQKLIAFQVEHEPAS